MTVMIKPRSTAKVWLPHPGPQLAFMRDKNTECLFGGANGGGKSSCLMMKGLYPMQLPEGRTLILRATFPQLSEIMTRAQRAFKGHAEWQESKRRFLFPTGATYEFGYGATEREIFEQYDGQEFDFIGVDEAGYLRSVKCLDLLRSRLRTKDPRLFVQLALTANPGQPLHAVLKKRYVEATNKGAKVDVWVDDETGYPVTRSYIRALVTDNPTVLATNPAYIANLNRLPEQLKRQRRDGDWDAGEGLFFGDMDETVHIIPKIDFPRYWKQWGGYDWGFSHWSSFVWLTRDEHGFTYVVDTVPARQLHPDQLAENIWERVPVDKLSTVYAGHDMWDVKQSEGVIGPTKASIFTGKGIPLVKADIARKRGWSVLRDLLAWRGRAPGEEDTIPNLRFFDTPGNRLLFDQISGLTRDETDAEDVRKENADPTTGDGGDDLAESLRYAVASHEPPPKAPVLPISAFDPAVLSFEYEKTHRPGSKIPPKPKGEVQEWW